MKYYIVAGCAVFAAIAAYFVMHMQHDVAMSSDPHEQWRRVAVEPETKERPARFEDMKFHPGAEVRAPASTGEKK